MKHRRLAYGVVLVGALALPAIAVSSTSCTTTPTEVPVRSLERSGRVAFTCLDVPTNPQPGLPTTACTNAPEVAPDAGIVPDAGAQIGPNLYAVVTQTTRGEIAVVNLSNGLVVDENTAQPGTSFLPIGGNPVDIVVTPLGTAAFASVSEVGHAGIFALPSSMLRPSITGAPPPTLDSWPSCALPAAPGEMILVDDPTSPKGTRPTCGAAYGSSPPAGSFGLLDAEGVGRQKLVVTLPDLGFVAVIDAQTVLDGAPGAFLDCPVERWIKLEATIPPAQPPAMPTGPACVNPAPNIPSMPPSSVPQPPRPAGLAFQAGRLYVADLAEPVIHVIDLPTPCDPVEVEPLLATSLEDPSRQVVTSRVSVSPTLTTDLKRYLYAIDVFDGSTIPFDVTPGAPRTPIIRPSPELNPFVPLDRIKFAAPARDVLIVQRDIPHAHPGSGVGPSGLLCDPNRADECLDTMSSACIPGASYRTSSDYLSGAGPNQLRGTFAFVLLTTGQIAIIDIEDYDAPCRGPYDQNALFGCGNATGTCLSTSGEVSCNVVAPHTPRAANFLMDNVIGLHDPGLSIFPLLTDVNGSVKPIGTEGASSARMIATIPVEPVGVQCIPTSGSEVVLQDINAQTYSLGVCETVATAYTPAGGTGKENNVEGVPGCTDPGFALAVGNAPVPIATTSDPKHGIIAGYLTSDGTPQGDPKHGLVMNFLDPRAQAADQNWLVTFEGPLPGFIDKVAEGSPFVLPASSSAEFAWVPQATLKDPNSRFCASGIHSANAVSEILTAQNQKLDDSPLLADYVQINSDLPESTDPYWRTPGLSCTLEECTAVFGVQQNELPGRDFEIIEAFDDQLQISPRPVSDTNGKLAFDPRITAGPTGSVKCCFPTQIKFNIRVGQQWVVTGDQSGFLHHVIPSPVDHTCRDSCDPNLVRMNGRVREAPANATVNDGDLLHAFLNPMFRFAVTAPTGSTSQRDDQFHFATQGSFVPFRISLSPDGTNVNPQSIALSPTGELAVPDGAQQGLVFVSTDTVLVSRQFF